MIQTHWTADDATALVEQLLDVTDPTGSGNTSASSTVDGAFLRIELVVKAPLGYMGDSAGRARRREPTDHARKGPERTTARKPGGNR